MSRRVLRNSRAADSPPAAKSAESFFRCVPRSAACALLVFCLIGIASAADLRTGYYHGQKVTFQNAGGVAIYQGDIILGETALIEAAPSSKTRESATVSSPLQLWPNGTIPYVVAGVSDATAALVQQAVDHWNTHTPIHLVQRTNEADYLEFAPNTTRPGCDATGVGKAGGVQSIHLADGCTVGNVIHEIGHAVGLWHEMERADRNRYITVLYENMDKASAAQFAQNFAGEADSGAYDFNSIMQYGATAFSRDGLAPTIETVPPGIPIGQRDGLSPGDIDAIRKLYGQAASQITLATTPSGLKLRADGALVDDRTALNWAPGSRHMIEAPFQGDDATRYVFGSWSDGGPASHDVIAVANTNLYVANFVVQRKIAVAAFPPGAGSVTFDPASPDGFYTDRSAIRISATPAQGYNFLVWSATPSRSMNPKVITVSASSSITNLVAGFSAVPAVTIASSPPGRVLTLDGATFTTPANFAWVKGESHRIGVPQPQPDDQFERHTFTGWSDGTAGDRTIQATGDAATYTANFTTQHSLTLTTFSSTAARGSRVVVDPAPQDSYYDEGSTIRLTASPAPTAGLLRWTGDLQGNVSPASLTMDGQKSVAATFALPSQFPSITAVNAADLTLPPDSNSPAIAPGEIITLYGANIGPADLAAGSVSGGKLSTLVGGTQVLFDGIASPLVYSSVNQVSAIVPYEIAGRFSTTVQIRYNGQPVATQSLSVTDAAPGIFTARSTGSGPGAILNQDAALNTPANPASRGSIIAIFATGDGAQSPAVATGTIENGPALTKPVLPVSVRIAGVPAIVQYAGAAPGAAAGLMQINAQVPDGIQTGPDVPISVVIGTRSSAPGVTVSVQ